MPCTRKQWVESKIREGMNSMVMLKNRIVIAVLFILILAASLLPFVTITLYNGQQLSKSMSLYECATVVENMDSATKEAKLRVPEMGESATALAGFTYLYLPLIAVIGIVITFAVKRFTLGTAISGFVGLGLTISELLNLKLQPGGENLAIGIAPVANMVLFAAAGITSTITHRKMPKEDTTGNINISDMIRKYGLLIAIVIMLVELSVLSNVFLTGENLINVLRQVSINGIMALGVTLVILTGGIDLSVGSLLAVSGVVVGSIVAGSPNAAIAAIFAGIAVCAVFGLVSGLFIARLRVPPFVATLAMMTVARGFALVYAKGRPYIITAKQYEFLGKGGVLGIPVPVIILILVVIITLVILNTTRWGRYIYAIGGNEAAARVSGVAIDRIKIFVYTFSGALAGLAGAVLASRIASGQPAVGEGYELDAIAAVVIGGTSLTGGVGSIFGTILGFLIIGLISNGLTLLGVSSYYQQIVKGAIILAAVLLDINSKGKGK